MGSHRGRHGNLLLYNQERKCNGSQRYIGCEENGERGRVWGASLDVGQ
jgi:hypothetical protein